MYTVNTLCLDEFLSIRLDKESKSRDRRSTGGSVKDKQLLIDLSTRLRPLQVHRLALYTPKMLLYVLIALFVIQKSILQDNLDLAKTLVKETSDINERDDDGCTALHTAARYSSSDAVKLLLQHGATSKVFDKVKESNNCLGCLFYMYLDILERCCSCSCCCKKGKFACGTSFSVS